MSTPAKLGGFGAALVAIFGIAAVMGNLAGPAPREENGGHMAEVVSVGEGVVTEAAGYQLVPTSAMLQASGGEFSFRIAGPHGTVTRFASTHERRLHLIVVNRELTSYHHVHPMLTPDGTWSVALPALPAGSYRAVADFQVGGGPSLALGIDLAVAGDYRPTVPVEPTRVAEVDGYAVELATVPGDDGEVRVVLTVRKDGTRVPVQPYLGAAGHLVAMRSSDLHYAHVHPLGYADGTVRFAATLPSAGRYRLFFDFKHGDTVHTAAFTFDQVDVTRAPSMAH